jgi:Flp pilus assembly pilin Flp
MIFSVEYKYRTSGLPFVLYCFRGDYRLGKGVIAMLSKHLKVLSKFTRCKNGATAIEYGLIVAAVAVAISTVVFTVGSDLLNLLQDLGTLITGA